MKYEVENFSNVINESKDYVSMCLKEIRMLSFFFLLINGFEEFDVILIALCVFHL